MVIGNSDGYRGNVFFVHDMFCKTVDWYERKNDKDKYRKFCQVMVIWKKRWE